MDDKGLSTMYDAILFIVMISLSSVILTPIFEMQTINQVSGDSYRENIAEETLHTFLVSMPLNFSYNIGGTLIDAAAETIGINTTNNDSLYHTITSWILSREQLHKTYNCIIAENLCSQFRIPISNNGSIILNPFTDDFNRKLKYEIERYFTIHLKDYNFNLTVWWHPIKGIPLGGMIQIGDPIPDTNCYHAEETFPIPIDIKFDKTLLYNISYTENITNLLSQNINNATIRVSLTENLTFLFKEFILDGFIDNNGIFHPSILDNFLYQGFSIIEDIIGNISSKLINIAIGEGFYTLQDIFGDTVNISNYTGLFNILEEKLLDYLNNYIEINLSNITDIIKPIEDIVKPVIWNILQPLVEQLISYIIDEISSSNITEVFMDLLFNQVSTKATAVLVIWEGVL